MRVNIRTTGAKVNGNGDVRLGMDASLPGVVPEKVKNKLALEFDFSRDKVQISAVLKEKWVKRNGLHNGEIGQEIAHVM
jgi:hypothetical protein